jgi:polar amino acid transport system substrate-binding protein
MKGRAQGRLVLNLQVKQILTLTTTLLFVACQSEQGPSTGTSGLDRVLETGVLRAGYVPYPPSLSVNPGATEFSGISHDVLSQIAGNLGVTLRYTEEVGWGSMIEAVESGRVDIIATAIWPTAARAKHADFTNAFFFSTVRSYGRVADDRFDHNLESLNSPGVRIAVIDGEMAATIASSDFPQAEQLQLTQLSDVSQLLLEVGTGKADVTFIEPAVANQFMAKNPGLVRMIEAPPVRVFPNVFLVKKGDTGLRDTLNIALSELLNSGYVDRVLSRYQTGPRDFARLAQPYADTR